MKKNLLLLVFIPSIIVAEDEIYSRFYPEGTTWTELVLDTLAQTGSNVKIQNNGRIIPRTNRDFYIPIGAKMQINYGRIK